jgi:hypothetical protein
MQPGDSASILAAAEQGLLVPGDGVGEGPEGLVSGAEERPFGKRTRYRELIHWVDAILCSPNGDESAQRIHCLI